MDSKTYTRKLAEVINNDYSIVRDNTLQSWFEANVTSP